MLLTIEDLEAATYEVSQFVACLQEPDGLEKWWSGHWRSPQQAVSERVVASSGVLIELAAYRKEGHGTIPQEVMLALSNPPPPVPFSLEAPLLGECIQESAKVTPIEAIAEHEKIPGKRVFRGIRDHKEEFRRQEAAAFRCHIFWPGGKALSLRKQPASGPFCPGCHWRFEPSSPTQQYCCSKCAQQKTSTAHHDKECGRFGRYTSRRLRQTIKDPVPGKPLDPRENRVAGGEKTEGIFLQIGIYAARAGRLSDANTDKVRDRFFIQFKSDVGRLSAARRSGEPTALVRDEILFQAWQTTKDNYRNPDRADDGFTRYVRCLLHQLAQPPYDPNVALTDPLHEEDPPLDEEAFSPHKKRRLRAADLSPPDRPSPQEAAAWARFDSLSTMYDLISKRIVPTSKNGGKIVLLPGWWECIQQWEEAKKEREEKASTTGTLAKALKKQSGIEYESAVKKVNRWLKKGKTVHEIRDLIGENAVRAAIIETTEDDEE